jgi:hypothetical protein
MKNPPYPPLLKGGFKKSPFEKGGFRGIWAFTVWVFTVKAAATFLIFL